jgi:PAS domain S-box-containing protein
MEHTPRIIIVEDIPDDAELIILALQDGGFDPIWKRVETVVELRAALENGPWDAVLSDYSLPVFSAEASLEIVREFDSDLPFIVVSGTVGEDIAARMMRAGANDYVMKPVLTRLAPALIREMREAENRRAGKKADKAMRASETRYRRLFEAAYDGILIVEMASGQILDVNPFLMQLLGYRRAELVGKELWEIGLFKDSEANKAAFRTLQENGYIRYDNLPLATKGGRVIEVEFVSNSYIAGDNRVIQCNIRDFTEQKWADKNLRKSEERYRTLIAATSAIVWDSPASGEFDSEQPGWTAFTGQTVEQHRGWGWLNAIHMDDRDKSARAWAAAVTNRSTYHIEHRVRRADGQFRLMSVRAVPIFEPDGEIREWVGVHTDMTDQLRVETERAELLTQLTLQIERMPLAYLLSGPDGRYTRWNPAAERVFGFSEAEVLGRLPIETIVPPQTETMFVESSARWAAGDMNAHGTWENVSKVGRTIVCEWHNTPLFGPNGDFQGVLALAQDVTARKQVEKELHLRDRAIQAATQGLLITDAEQPDHPIIYVSPAFERITGYRSEEVIGRNCRFLQGKDTDPASVDQLRESIQTAQSCIVELLNYRKDRKSFWNELSISPIRDAAGKMTHFVGVMSDVTTRRSLQEQFRQAQKIEAIGQLAGGVAHDFNNLLTIIGGNSEFVLADAEVNGDIREAVQEIREASERAAALTQKLLAFSRQTLLELKVVDMNAIIADTGRMLRRLIDKNININIVLTPDLSLVRIDPIQFDQILMNLAVNARDAMPHGGQLTIATTNVVLSDEYSVTRPNCATGPHVMLAMTDTGCGMTREVAQRIFEPFYTTKPTGKGTGLGLAMVFGIVQQSGGSIHVYSEPDCGTTFKIYFPAVDEPAHSTVVSDEVDQLAGHETVLVVEDEEGVRRLVVRNLTQYGYHVLVAVDAAEALQIAITHSGSIDLLLTDVVMPNGSGPELAESIRLHLPTLEVLFMSGYTDDAVVRHGLLRAEVWFIQKPFSSLALLRKVRNVLDAGLKLS